MTYVGGVDVAHELHNVDDFLCRRKAPICARMHYISASVVFLCVEDGCLMETDDSSVNVNIEEQNVRIFSPKRCAKMLGQEHQCVCENAVEFPMPLPELSIDRIARPVVGFDTMEMGQVSTEEACDQRYPRC